jgi:hypothetical protein
MIKKIIGFLAVTLMLAAPCLNAGLADWISSVVPPSMRLPDEMRREIANMKEKSNNSTPVICINSERRDSVIASAESIGFPFFHFAILRFDLNKMKENINAENKATIAHELTHAQKNHGGEPRAWDLLGLFSFIGLGETLVLGSLYLYHHATDTQNLYSALSKVAIPFFTFTGSTYYSIQKLKAHRAEYEKNKQAIREQCEMEAETGAFKTMAQCGYCSDIKTVFNEIVMKGSDNPAEHVRNGFGKLKIATATLNLLSEKADEDLAFLERKLNKITPEQLITMNWQEINRFMMPKMNQVRESLSKTITPDTVGNTIDEYGAAKLEILRGWCHLHPDECRPRGPIYPTLSQTIAYQKAALKECQMLQLRKIDLKLPSPKLSPKLRAALQLAKEVDPSAPKGTPGSCNTQ